MLEYDAGQLFEKLQARDESVEIEAKRGGDVGKSIFETVSAFANEPGRGGGDFLLGVVRATNVLFPTYEVVGVSDPDKVQADLATICRGNFSISIRPDISVEELDGKTVIIAHIPEAAAHDKPVYIESRGVQNGSFRRIGSTDQLCTDDDLEMFYQSRGGGSYDETSWSDTSLEDIDPEAVAAYRRLRVDDASATELLSYSDEDLLYALGATTRENGRTVLTLTGLILFGKTLALRRHLPMTRVDYIRVEGREWVPDPEKRYQTVEKLSALIFVIPSLVSQVMEDIPKAFTLADDGIHRKDIPLVPRNVIREAIVNALMHRNYRKHSPVQIIRYANRIEIRNAGYSLKPEEQLGQPTSVPRNPKIAAVLHDVGLAETKGTGIRAMREAKDRANLTQPLFESDRSGDTFTIRLLAHHLLSPEDWKWLERFKNCNLSDDDARALIVAREIGAIDNAAYRSIIHVDTLTASGNLRRLRDSGLLEQKGQSRATYYVPTSKLLGQKARVEPTKVRKLREKENTEEPQTQVEGLNPTTYAQVEGLGALPEGLTDTILDLKHRNPPKILRDVIYRLCCWKSLNSSHLAGLLGKRQNYLVEKHLRPMLEAGELEHIYPDNPAHPKQAYRAISGTREVNDTHVDQTD
jgi:ATP-dependent DNA helicase RecG